MSYFSEMKILLEVWFYIGLSGFIKFGNILFFLNANRIRLSYGQMINCSRYRQIKNIDFDTKISPATLLFIQLTGMSVVT